MNRFEISKEYFYKRLSKYSKQDILNAMFNRIDYITLDHIANDCELKKQINKTKTQTNNDNKTSKYISEYNLLCEELKKKGIKNIGLTKVERMSKLLELITKGERTETK
jgi:hypothetical protein